MSTLAEYIDKNYSKIEKYFSTNKAHSTEPITFTIPKNNLSRREYKIPNIYSYLNLMFFIQKNKQEFQKYL